MLSALLQFLPKIPCRYIDPRTDATITGEQKLSWKVTVKLRDPTKEDVIKVTYADLTVSRTKIRFPTWQDDPDYTEYLTGFGSNKEISIERKLVRSFAILQPIDTPYYYTTRIRVQTEKEFMPRECLFRGFDFYYGLGKSDFWVPFQLETLSPTQASTPTTERPVLEDIPTLKPTSTLMTEQPTTDEERLEELAQCLEECFNGDYCSIDIEQNGDLCSCSFDPSPVVIDDPNLKCCPDHGTIVPVGTCCPLGSNSVCCGMNAVSCLQTFQPCSKDNHDVLENNDPCCDCPSTSVCIDSQCIEYSSGGSLPFLDGEIGRETPTINQKQIGLIYFPTFVIFVLPEVGLIKQPIASDESAIIAPFNSTLVFEYRNQELNSITTSIPNLRIISDRRLQQQQQQCLQNQRKLTYTERECDLAESKAKWCSEDAQNAVWNYAEIATWDGSVVEWLKEQKKIQTDNDVDEIIEFELGQLSKAAKISIKNIKAVAELPLLSTYFFALCSSEEQALRYAIINSPCCQGQERDINGKCCPSVRCGDPCNVDATCCDSIPGDHNYIRCSTCGCITDKQRCCPDGKTVIGEFECCPDEPVCKRGQYGCCEFENFLCDDRCSGCIPPSQVCCLDGKEYPRRENLGYSDSCPCHLGGEYCPGDQQCCVIPFGEKICIDPLTECCPSDCPGRSLEGNQCCQGTCVPQNDEDQCPCGLGGTYCKDADQDCYNGKECELPCPCFPEDVTIDQSVFCLTSEDGSFAGGIQCCQQPTLFSSYGSLNNNNNNAEGYTACAGPLCGDVVSPYRCSYGKATLSGDGVTTTSEILIQQEITEEQYNFCRAPLFNHLVEVGYCDL